MRQDLLLLASEVLSEDFILEELEGALTKYKFDKSSENKSTIGLLASMFLSKQVLEAEGIDKVREDLKQISSIQKIMKPGTN